MFDYTQNLKGQLRLHSYWVMNVRQDVSTQSQAVPSILCPTKQQCQQRISWTHFFLLLAIVIFSSSRLELCASQYRSSDVYILIIIPTRGGGKTVFCCTRFQSMKLFEQQVLQITSVWKLFISKQRLKEKERTICSMSVSIAVSISDQNTQTPL